MKVDQRRLSYQNRQPLSASPTGRPVRPVIVAPRDVPAADMAFRCDCGASISFKHQVDASPSLARFGWRRAGGAYLCPKCPVGLEKRFR